MNIIKYAEIVPAQIREGVERRVAHFENLMLALIDFHDGPKAELDPPYAHPHEQVTYMAEGKVLVEIGEESTRPGSGCVFIVPSNIFHSIQQLTEHVRLVDCFNPIREDFV